MRPVASTTQRVHSRRDCGKIAFEIPILFHRTHQDTLLTGDADLWVDAVLILFRGGADAIDGIYLDARAILQDPARLTQAHSSYVVRFWLHLSDRVASAVDGVLDSMIIPYPDVYVT